MNSWCKVEVPEQHHQSNLESQRYIDINTPSPHRPQLSMSQNNYSIHSIAAAYAVGLFPHGCYYVKMMANAKDHATNIVYAQASLTNTLDS